MAADNQHHQSKPSFVERLARRANYILWLKATQRVAAELGRIVKRPEPAEAGRAVAARLVGRSEPLARVGRNGLVAGVAGALAGATSEAVGSYRALRDQQIDGPKLARAVVRTGARSGVATGGRVAGAIGLQEVAKRVAVRAGSAGLQRLARSGAASGVAYAVVEQSIDTVRLARGAIDGREYGARTSQNVGGTCGALGGAAAGAALGSVVPVVGTTVGALVGGIIGGTGGSLGGRRLGERLFAKKAMPADDPAGAEGWVEATVAEGESGS